MPKDDVGSKSKGGRAASAVKAALLPTVAAMGVFSILAARIGSAADDARSTIPFMIDHIVLTVQSYEKSKAFYLKALNPLGYGLVKEYPGGRPAYRGA